MTCVLYHLSSIAQRVQLDPQDLPTAKIKKNYTKMTSPRRPVVQLRAGSDGDASHVPKPGTYTQLDPPTLYLEKIGQQWLEARGEAQVGVEYTLASLPAGYTLWHRPCAKDPEHFDKYLYGHPSRKAFDSPDRFYPHFEHLMNNGGDSMGCPCTICNSTSDVPLKSASGSVNARSPKGASSNASSRPLSRRGPMQSFIYSTKTQQEQQVCPASPLPGPITTPSPPTASSANPSVQYKGRPKLLGTGMDMKRVDEEGTPDVYRNLISKLQQHGEIDETIEEPMSLDWRAEQEILPGLLRKLKDSPQWVPRVGDIVLYVRDLPEDVDILRDPVTREYRMHNEKTNSWLDHPIWEAGLVGQIPAEPIMIDDIYQNGNKESNVIYSGVRVEPLPDVNSLDKSLSKRHKYIPIRYTRPFMLWKQLLHQVSEWHPTILNAQAVTSTLSLVGKYRFKGVWPEASVYCRGIYIGHEMLVVGDTVRLLPSVGHSQTTCTDILVIKSIRLKWTNLDKASGNDWDTGQPYNSSIWVYGAAYTSDSARTNEEWLSNDHLYLPKEAKDYGKWYPLHSSSKELAVPYSRIMGRLYERNAMALWLDTKSNDHPLLDAGREGLVESRVFAKKHDQRIAREPDATWYWGDSRAQALDLRTVNGLDVAAYDQERDPKEWRKKIKIMEGMTGNKIVPKKKLSGARSLAERNPREVVAPALPGLHLHSKLSKAIDETSVSGHVTASPSIRESSATTVSRKRPHIVSLSSDEEDDRDEDLNEEIKRTMRIVEDDSQTHTKKVRVAVVIN